MALYDDDVAHQERDTDIRRPNTTSSNYRLQLLKLAVYES